MIRKPSILPLLSSTHGRGERRITNLRRAVRAFTLIELLIVVAIMGILITAVSYGFVAGLDLERRQAKAQLQRDQVARAEQRITSLLQSTYLSGDANDTSTFFVGQTEGDGVLGADRLTFTTTGPGLPLVTLDSTDDFETQNQNQGPVGGVTEISYAMTAVGDPGDRTGLFERIQRPADGDPTQGGTEAVLASQIESIGFQFYSGTDWVDVWDTTSGERRLPAAVKVRYTLTDDPAKTEHSFIVPIPSSDVDAQDPSLNGGTL